jgi:LPXTG-motif cell wall-anchored protein
VVKKVVAAAAAASGLVLAGAGLAVADTGKHASAANLGGNAFGHNPTCVDSTNSNGRHTGPQNPSHPEHPGKEQPKPGKGHEHPHQAPKPHHPHHPQHPKPHVPVQPHHPGAEVPGPSKDHPMPGQLAHTGSDSEELRLMLAGSTGLMLGGAILFRRTRRRGHGN